MRFSMVVDPAFTDFFKEEQVKLVGQYVCLSLTGTEYYGDLAEEDQLWLRERSMGTEGKTVGDNPVLSFHFPHGQPWSILQRYGASRVNWSALRSLEQLLKKEAVSFAKKEAYDIVDLMYVCVARSINPRENWKTAPKDKFRIWYDADANCVCIDVPTTICNILTSRGGEATHQVERCFDVRISLH